MIIREDDPVTYRRNIHNSWKLMAYVVSHIDEDCFVAHLEPNQGASYDCLSLVTRDADGNSFVRFMLNRNGINSDILENVWRKVDTEGVEKVAEQLIANAQLKRAAGIRISITSRVCEQVVTWIDEHSADNFYVGPQYWFGACTDLLDIPFVKVTEEIWPIPDHGPELILGLDGREVMRITQHDGKVWTEEAHSSHGNETVNTDDKYYAYIYRDPTTKKVRYAGYATNSSRAFTAGHNEKIAELTGSNKALEILISGPYRDEEEARNVESALVSAMELDLNLIQQPGKKFSPLGVPGELGDRRVMPPLDVHDIGRMSGGALVVLCSLTAQLKDPIPKVGPTNFADDIVFGNIQDHWMVSKFMPGWIEDPLTSPKLLVAVQGPAHDRYVIGSAYIDPPGWATTPTSPRDKSIHRIPLITSKGLDGAELRGRRASVKFNAGKANTIMYVDGTGLVLHGYQLKGKSHS